VKADRVPEPRRASRSATSSAREFRNSREDIFKGERPVLRELRMDGVRGRPERFSMSRWRDMARSFWVLGPESKPKKSELEVALEAIYKLWVGLLSICVCLKVILRAERSGEAFW